MAASWRPTRSGRLFATCATVLSPFGGIFDFDRARERLDEVQAALEDPAVWKDPDRAEALGRERAQFETLVRQFDRIERSLNDSADLLEMAELERDEGAVAGVERDVDVTRREIEQLEFRRMFSGKHDAANAFVDIQAGSGGTEAQDWAEMLLRMYLKYCERKGFAAELLEASAGEVAGIKSATVRVAGEYACGWLRTESGVHRLVRKSPFDSGNRRHTSFAAVFVSPEIDDDIEIEINPADLRVDVYRASGAGGQHVNRTESAVRITHLPTNVVVQCQSERSQHKNRATAMKQLRAKLYQLEEQKRRAEAQIQEDSKADIGWGSQIRSYVLDQSRVKDLRTGVEAGNPDDILNGDLDRFILASLKQGL
ncbi:MAG: peptide chain release factor 2 [Nevskiales bacterium]